MIERSGSLTSEGVELVEKTYLSVNQLATLVNRCGSRQDVLPEGQLGSRFGRYRDGDVLHGERESVGGVDLEGHDPARVGVWSDVDRARVVRGEEVRAVLPDRRASWKGDLRL